MCKHILNAQVAIRAPCCRKWFDCPQCHADTQDHRLAKTVEMTMLCKACKKAFRKDLGELEEADEYCPHCDNHYVIAAKTAAPVIGVEGEDARVDNRMIRDGRTKWDPKTDFYAREYEAQASERIDPGGVAAALKERMTGQAAGTGSGAGAGNAAKLQGEIEAKLRAEGRSGVMEFDENDLDWS